MLLYLFMPIKAEMLSCTGFAATVLPVEWPARTQKTTCKEGYQRNHSYVVVGRLLNGWLLHET
jgi:hypothetical protein